MLHNDPAFFIYYGDSRKGFNPKTLEQTKSLLTLPVFSHLKKLMKLNNLIFMHQVHGTDGVVISCPEKADEIEPFGEDGDFMVTSVSHLGLGVATADCLPIIYYDPVHNVTAIAHAGWRGSLDGIAAKVVTIMKKRFKSDPAKIKIFYGPSAKKCCYEIGQDFIERISQEPCFDQVIHRANGGYHFDVPQYNMYQLEKAGIKRAHINTNYNICTICDRSFCSYRREGKAAERQMTVVALK